MSVQTTDIILSYEIDIGIFSKVMWSRWVSAGCQKGANNSGWPLIAIL